MGLDWSEVVLVLGAVLLATVVLGLLAGSIVGAVCAERNARRR